MVIRLNSPRNKLTNPNPPLYQPPLDHWHCFDFWTLTVLPVYGLVVVVRPAIKGEGNEDVDRFWKQWNVNFEGSLRCFQYYLKAQTHKPGEGPGGVSLIVHPHTGDLACIQWAVTGKTGRVADVDDNNYLKCIVPVGPKRVPLDLEEAQILIPAAGAFALRERRTAMEARRSKVDLNRLPDDLLRFMEMWRASNSLSPMAENCFICGAAELSACPTSVENEVGEELTQTQLALCPMCLLCSHPQCCWQLSCDSGQHMRPLDNTLDLEDARLTSLFPAIFNEGDSDSAERKQRGSHLGWVGRRGEVSVQVQVQIWQESQVLFPLFPCLLCWTCVPFFYLIQAGPTHATSLLDGQTSNGIGIHSYNVEPVEVGFSPRTHERTQPSKPQHLESVVPKVLFLPAALSSISLPICPLLLLLRLTCCYTIRS